MTISTQKAAAVERISCPSTFLAPYIEFNAKLQEYSVKLLQLNMNMAKNSMAEYAAAGRDYLSIKTPQEMFLIGERFAKKKTEDVAVYSKQMAAIATELGECSTQFSQGGLGGQGCINRYIGNFLEQCSKQACGVIVTIA